MRRNDVETVGSISEVEEVLATYPFVTGAVVEGGPGAGPVRAVVSIDRRAAVSVDALLRHAGSLLPEAWVPTEVSFVSSVEADLEGPGGDTRRTTAFSPT